MLHHRGRQCISSSSYICPCFEWLQLLRHTAAFATSSSRMAHFWASAPPCPGRWYKRLVVRARDVHAVDRVQAISESV
ncbi:hypothetical protein PsYK624_107650 [Phanerochaete sordida]|uniref:Uncharacterized protein n=1 Tax=Phanerochaete sordida TaxID=48140 RepID=A0A9P3GGL9_9APHY|nr:hypothetical protein PsYK624_107650 [Phanerochaete sordida]